MRVDRRAVLLLACAALTACSTATPTPTPSSPPGATAKFSTSSPVVTPTTRATVELLTHCGIRWLKVDDVWFEREGGLLGDGQGNPPPGWDNPFQTGRVVVTGDSAVFTDDAGHRETFKRMVGEPKAGCD